MVIIDPKSNMEFKVNGQRLKPFLTTEPVSQAETMLSFFRSIVHLTIAIHTPFIYIKKLGVLFDYMLTPSFCFAISFAYSHLAGPSQRVTSFLHPLYCICIYM